MSEAILNIHLSDTGGSIEFIEIPVHQFKWLIILSALAFHGIIAVILAELMGRSYGKSMLWFAIAFFLPIIGPISIYLYHLTLATSVTDARKQSFWERLLTGGPVSLARILIKERAMAQEVVLHDYKISVNERKQIGKDKEIEALIEQGDYGGARALAWQIMEVARGKHDDATTARYQEYLELIAEEEALSEGVESTPCD